MAKRPPPAGKNRGSKRMAEFGYKPCQVWFDAAEADLVQKAARRAGQRLATWVRRVAVDAAALSARPRTD